MNIFYISADPAEAARMMVDRHVVKMIVETAQLLSTAHRVLDADCLSEHMAETLYKKTHANHPSAKWTRESEDNYCWLYLHFVALCKEYTYRYNKTHATERLLDDLAMIPRNIPSIGPTPIACAMPDEYKIDSDPVINYRTYYRIGKSHLHTWKNREVPDWIY